MRSVGLSVGIVFAAELGQKLGHMQALDTLFERVVALNMSQVSPVHTILDLRVFLKSHCMCLILAITLGLLSVDDVRMQRDLALLSLLLEWPHKLLDRFATLISSDRLQLLVDRVGHRARHHHAVLATRALCHASVARPEDAMAHNRCLW